jgi:hypothetical protein
MARRYHDLWCLLRAGLGRRALTNMDLFRRVAAHREVFFRVSWADDTTHRPGAFRLVPPADHLAAWRTDCEEMLGPMFFGPKECTGRPRAKRNRPMVNPEFGKW